MEEADIQRKDRYEVLTQKREQKGWCTAIAAEKLALTETAIRHLESGDADYFPKGPYFSGYLRRYCEYLEVNPEPLLTVYYDEKGDDDLGAYQEPPMHKMKLTSAYQHKKHKTVYGLACAVMVCVLVAAVTSQTLMTTISAPETAPTKVMKLGQRSLAESASDLDG